MSAFAGERYPLSTGWYQTRDAQSGTSADETDDPAGTNHAATDLAELRLTQIRQCHCQRSEVVDDAKVIEA
ncbi:hypothetical protein WT63_23570 [Burkholderia anthina]|nr:hypothetical protein WT63_23570 [Burkholderia anthina]